MIKKGEEYYVSTPSLKDARIKYKALVSYLSIQGIKESVVLIKETKVTEVLEETTPEQLKESELDYL